jgi:hypothetical protein
VSKLALPPSGLSFSAIYLGERAGRSHGGNRGLKFVFPAGYDIALALHHRLETDARNFGGVVLFRLTDFCIHHAGALKKLRVSGSRHEAGDGHAAVLELVSERERERVYERFGAVVNCRKSAWHKPGNGTRDQDATAAMVYHVASDALHKVKRSGDVRIDDVPNLIKILIEKSPAQATAGISNQDIPPVARSKQRIIYPRL